MSQIWDNGATMVHAHWDCSRGVSANAVLSACFRSVRCRKKRQEWIEELEAILSGTFQNDVRLVQASSNNSIIRIQVNTSQPDETFESWKDLSDYILRNCDKLSSWNKELTSCTLMELHRVEETRSKTNMPSHSITMALEIIAVFYFLDRIGIRTCSFGPLPLARRDDLNVTWRGQELLIGLDVAVSTHPVTDTAAAIFKVLSRTQHKTPVMTLLSVATGVDTELGVELQLNLGELVTNDKSQLWATQQMLRLEANLDDITPEHLSFCLQLLINAGAADAWTAPIVMKKGRAAHTLYCLCHHEQRDELLEILFRHSTTLGVRMQPIDRAALRRTIVSVIVGEANVDVKVGFLGDEIVSMKAEFDHCQDVSMKTGMPIQSVAQQAVHLCSVQLQSEGPKNSNCH